MGKITAERLVQMNAKGGAGGELAQEISGRSQKQKPVQVVGGGGKTVIETRKNTTKTGKEKNIKDKRQLSRTTPTATGGLEGRLITRLGGDPGVKELNGADGRTRDRDLAYKRPSPNYGRTNGLWISW